MHHEAHLLPAWLPSVVQVIPVCAGPSCGTLTVCHRRREHKTDQLRPLPAYADAAFSTGQVGDPSSHLPLSDDEPHAARAGPPHMTHRNHAQCDGADLPARPAGAQLPTRRAESSSGDQLGLEGGQTETQAAHRQGQR